MSPAVHHRFDPTAGTFHRGSVLPTRIIPSSVCLVSFIAALVFVLTGLARLIGHHATFASPSRTLLDSQLVCHQVC